MSDSLKFPEGAFIRPAEANLEHKFMCCNPKCHSRKLHIDFNPYKGELTLSCHECGNYVTMNFALGNEVEHGG